jgi:ubiquinone/menaquinone biosynthesis C-methylase UbiE
VTARDAEKTHYVIRGGVEGRERLRILARVMRPATLSLLDRAGVKPGMACLDIGCGGGDVSFDLARLVGPSGRVVGIDIDEVKIEIARSEATTQRIANIEFRLANIGELEQSAEFDFAHARFILSHLPNPTGALAKIRQAIRPGGILVVADTDFRGYFCDPECPALWRYVELYTQTVKRRGGDANIGPRLPRLLTENGFEKVQMNVAQAAGTEGEVKLLIPLTMENIADAVLAEGLASRTEIDKTVSELYEFARAPGTVASASRVVEAWGYRTQVRCASM